MSSCLLLTISIAALILVPRARRFLVTWSSLQIEPGGSGDKNAQL